MARCQQPAHGFKSSVIHSNGEVCSCPSLSNHNRTTRFSIHIRGAWASVVTAHAPMLKGGSSRGEAGARGWALRLSSALVGEADGMLMQCAG